MDLSQTTKQARFASRNLGRRWLAVLLMFGLCAPCAWGDCQKVVAWKHKPPYLFRAADGSVHGIHADLIREVMHRMGCRVEFDEMPWARAMTELQSGRVDMLPGAGSTPEREQFAYFSRPTNQARNVLFISKSAATAFHFSRLADIENTSFRMGVTIKAAYGGDYDGLVSVPRFAARLVPFTDRESGWKMILAGRSDGLIADELTGNLEIQTLKYTDAIQQSKLTISADNDLVAISKRTSDESFVDRFNKTLDGMVADGSYKRIFLQNYSCKLSLVKLGCE